MEKWWQGDAGRARLGRGVVALLLGAMALAYFHELGLGDLKDWDESLYAVRALAIVRHGGTAWIDQTPWSRHEFSADRTTHSGYYSSAFPPLLPWMSAASFHLFGVSEWSYRLPVTLVAASGLLAVFLLLLPWAGEAGALAGAAALFDVVFYTHYARRGQFDALFITWLLWSLVAYQAALRAGDARRRRGMLVLAGVALGLSAMSKIALGVVFFVGLALPVIGVRLAARRAGVRAALEEVAIVGGVALALWLPWHLAMSLRGGLEFWDWYVGFHLLRRAGQVLDLHQQSPWFYLAMLHEVVPPATAGMLAALAALAGAALLLPRRWSPLAPDAAAALPPRSTGAHLAALWGVALTLGLISASSTRRDTYFLVVVPFLALCAGLVAGAAWQGRLRPAALAGVAAWMMTTVVWDRSAGERKNFALLLDGLGTRFTGEDFVAYLGHALPPIVLGGVGAAVVLGAACWAVSRWALRRRVRVSLLLGRLLVLVYVGFSLNHAFGEALDEERGRRFYGWQGIRRVVHAEKHDELLFLGGYDGPATGFYLLGALWADHTFSEVTRARSAAEAIARLDAGGAERLLIVTDRGTTPRAEADALSRAARERGWRFLGRSNHLYVYAPPALQYDFAELRGMTRRVTGSAIRRSDAAFEEFADEEEEGAAPGAPGAPPGNR